MLYIVHSFYQPYINADISHGCRKLMQPSLVMLGNRMAICQTRVLAFTQGGKRLVKTSHIPATKPPVNRDSRSMPLGFRPTEAAVATEACRCAGE